MPSTKTKIQDIFVRDITRELNGVIKVDQEDEKNVFTELDEYVVTRESLKMFNDFFSNFQNSLHNPTDKVGVWVSGYFGSGKSHFIKILSYLLENRNVKGKCALDFFREKIQDPHLFNTIEECVTSGTRDVILFNIESKANTMHKETEPIVSVFMRVFNEIQGYLGDTPRIADLERDLSRKGKYEKFKTIFNQINGDTWEEKRGAYAFEQDDIIEALERCDYQSKDSITRLFELDGGGYTLSIESFTNRVKEYCESIGPEHQVIFLVDEIGQYIGDNSSLLLNLQTVVEELGTHLAGKAWVVVTSQADIDSTVGKVKEYDFSKIQARFDTRLPLSSTNVDEVIRKRILDKKEEFKESLESYYIEKQTILRNLIAFSRSGPEMKTYRSTEDFISVYPFVPYQFKLLQEVFDNIRQTGFTGKHLAKGERSQLSAFKESTEFYCNHELGQLVPFSSFYLTVESFLDPIIRKTIIQAQENAHLNELDCEILKLLFLIRHVKLVQPNPDNLTILSVSHVDVDKKKLREQITETLTRLERETLIQKTGDNYFFLTNIEQEIRKQIKNIEIDQHKLIEVVHNETFTTICPSSYKSYHMNKIVDDRAGRKSDADLTVRFLTPESDEYRRAVGQKSLEGDPISDIGSKDTLLFVFPEDNPAINQIRDYLKIRKYLNQNLQSNKEDEILRILTSIRQEQDSLERAFKESLKDAIRHARVFVDGRAVILTKREPVERIREGLDKLVENVYKKASYVTMDFESPDEIFRILTSSDLERFGASEGKTNHLALKEMLEFISLRNEQNKRVLLKDLKDRFGRKPYGWKSFTISGLVGMLSASDKVHLYYHNEPLISDKKRIVEHLTRKSDDDKLIVKFRMKIDDALIRSVKEILRENFRKVSLPKKESELFEILKLTLKELSSMEETYLAHFTEEQRLPGLTAVKGHHEFLNDLMTENEPSALFKCLVDRKQELITLQKDAEKVHAFFNSSQVTIFRRVLKKMDIYRRNSQFLPEEVKGTIGNIAAILDLSEPYSDIKDLPPYERIVDDAIDETIEDLKKRVSSQLNQVFGELERALEQHELISNEFMTIQLKRFDEIREFTDHEKDCALVESQFHRIRDLQKDILEKMDAEIQRKVKEGGQGKPIEYRGTEIISSPKHFRYQKVIKTEKDLDDYISQLKERLKAILKNKDIRLS